MGNISPPHTNINVDGCNVLFSSYIKLLGIALDNSLSLNINKCVSIISKAWIFHLRALRHIRHTLVGNAAKNHFQLAHRLTAGLRTGQQFAKNINRMQHMQNTLVQIIMKVSRDQTRNFNTMHLLSTLHWFPVRHRLYYKIAVLNYKLLSTDQPIV